jgi:hypothetical protein
MRHSQRHLRSWVVLMAILPASVLRPAPGEAQTAAQPITGEPTCRACTIERVLIATINDSTYARGVFVPTAFPFVTADTTFILAGGPGFSELFLADRSGSIVRQVGRRGRGPGEYQFPIHVMENPSSFAVFDPKLHRLTRLSKPALNVTQSVLLPEVGDLKASPVMFPDGSFVLAADIRSRERVGYPLHRFSAKGELLTSFGEEAARPAPAARRPVALAAAADGAVWVVYHTYRLEKWDRSGNLSAVYERRADWLMPRDPGPKQPGDRWSEPVAIEEDVSGRVWVYSILRRWISVNGRVRVDTAPSANSAVIDVIDPRSAALVASSRIDHWRASSTGRALFVIWGREVSSGQHLLDIWGFRLRVR